MSQKLHNEILTKIIILCHDVAWGRNIDEQSLYNYTIEGSCPEQLRQLSEAFGLMLVKLGIREEYSARLIQELQEKNQMLEKSKRKIQARNNNLMDIVKAQHGRKKIVAQCEPMQEAVRVALAIAKRPVNTMLLGETGTGKEEFAKLIHFSSARREGPFIAVNCSAIPDSLFESEMFGIEKGVATGVVQKKGILEEANGGTLFLDEIADMPLSHQAKILRVLEERSLTRVGSAKKINLDIKVISAANVDLEKAVKEERFRMDLFYRLNVTEIQIPPLRERGEDIILLAQKFLDYHCQHMQNTKLTLSMTAKQALLAYTWPGNVRELNNEMERAVVLTLSDIVELEDLSPKIQDYILAYNKENTDNTKKVDEVLDDIEQKSAKLYANNKQDKEKNIPILNSYNLQELEQECIIQVLQKTNGNRTQAAELLGITREGLRKKILRYGN